MPLPCSKLLASMGSIPGSCPAPGPSWPSAWTAFSDLPEASSCLSHLFRSPSLERLSQAQNSTPPHPRASLPSPLFSQVIWELWVPMGATREGGGSHEGATWEGQYASQVEALS